MSMIRRQLRAFVAFLRSPAQWTLVLCTAAVVLFLQIFGDWTFRSGGLYGQLFTYVKLFVWLCLAIGAGLLLHYGFDQLTDWLARAQEPRPGEKRVPPTATIFR
jgi:hypothetical protein